MKWFKHYSSARGDERISRLEDKTGLEGYGFYFKLLEVIAEVMNETDNCEVTYSRSRWGRQLNITTKKFLTLAQRCSDVGLITLRQSGDNYTIATPNLLKYRDNHTKNLQATCKQVVSNLPLEKEKEKEKENPSASDDAGVVYSQSFLTFWDMYPNKKNKGLAFKSFKKIKSAEYPAIKAGLIAAKSSESWLKNNGQFIPHPSSWLNARGWEDEVGTTQSGGKFNVDEWMKQVST